MIRDHTNARARFRILAGVFVLALVLGPGPASTIIDGTPEKPVFIAGIPALYLWLVFWFIVMAGCILAAARLLWKDDD